MTTIERMRDALEPYRVAVHSSDDKVSQFGLDNVTDATFDFDQHIEQEQHTTRKQEKKERRAQEDLERFNSTLAYVEKQRKERLETGVIASTSKQHRRGSPSKTRKVDLITDMSEIDELDHGKTWRQLDDYMKRKKLQEYAVRHRDMTGDDITTQLLTKFRKGGFRRTSDLTYDVGTGMITELKN